MINSIFVGNGEPILDVQIQEQMLNDWSSMSMVELLDHLLTSTNVEHFFSHFKGKPLVFEQILQCAVRVSDNFME
jgi:hypothetical protein